MGDWRLLDPGHETGMQEWFMHDAEAGKNYIQYRQDASPVLDLCKRDNNHADKAREMRGDAVHVASVPPGVQMEWFTKYGVEMWNPDHQKAVHRLLDTEYKHLKRLPIWLGDHDTSVPTMKTVKGRRIDNIPRLPAAPELIGFG